MKLVYIASGQTDWALPRPGGVVSGFHGEELSHVQPDAENYAGFVASATPESPPEALAVTAEWQSD